MAAPVLFVPPGLSLAEQWAARDAGRPKPPPDAHAGETILEHIARNGRELREQLTKIDKSIDELTSTAEEDQLVNDARALEDLEKAAEHLRRREPDLSAAQAFAKACDAKPDLYARHCRHQQRAAARVDDTAIAIGDLADRQIDERAAAIAKSAGITHAQAVARVLEQTPALYERSRAGQLAKSQPLPDERSPLSFSASPRREEAWDAMEKAAEKLMEADPDLSKQQAIAKALEQNPDLYGRYLTR